ncbi:type IV secretory system conjugative DNA transfer family protein [Marinomonas sp. TI.3.20]|uniref:type IV secretory system conjugative DNA transfer family protein n=1 Tax=Marinomonas sp. TI.3.20 TaxID=3121296 RepID=UPI00311EC649
MASNKDVQISGFNNHQIYDQEEIITYRGSIYERALIYLFLRPRYLIVTFITFCVMAVLMVAGYGFISLVLYVLHYFLTVSSRSDRENSTLPARLPPQMKKYLPKKMHGDLGDFYCGTEVKTNRQIWKKSGDFLYHTLILAGSGSGKTSLILSVFYINALALSSGLWMKDFKGTVRLIGEMVSIAMLFSRQDDVRVVNYNNPQKIGSTLKNTCTMNLHTTDRAYDSFSNLNVYMGSGQSNDPFFKDNAEKILNAVLPILHYLQENNYERIKPSTIRNYLVLDNFVNLYHDKRVDKDLIEAYLVPTYEALGLEYKDEINKQIDDNVRLFSNFINNVDPALAFLIFQFPQIHESITAEFNPRDLVLNRRIGITINPTASLSVSDTEALAKTTLNQVKFGLGVGLGSDFHGKKDQVMYSARTSDDVPYIFVADEFFVGLKAGGLGLVAAQGRGCGIAAVYSTQDLIAAEETNKLEMGQITGSTANKLFMLTRELERTRAVFEALIPKIKVPVKKISDSASRNILTDKNVEIQEVPAFNIDDLAHKSKMPQGNFLFIGDGHVTRGQSYYYPTDEFEAESYRTIVQLPTIPINHSKLRSAVDDFKLASKITTLLDEGFSEQHVKFKQDPDSKQLLGYLAGKIPLAAMLMGIDEFKASKKARPSTPSKAHDANKTTLGETGKGEETIRPPKNDAKSVDTDSASLPKIDEVDQLIGRSQSQILSVFKENSHVQASTNTSTDISHEDEDDVSFGSLVSENAEASESVDVSFSSISAQHKDDESYPGINDESNLVENAIESNSESPLINDEYEGEFEDENKALDNSIQDNKSNSHSLDRSTALIAEDNEVLASVIGGEEILSVRNVFTENGLEGFDELLPKGNIDNKSLVDDYLINDTDIRIIKERDNL